MASIACDLCGEETAVMMQTNLGTGDTLAIGQSCLLTFTLSMAATFSAEVAPEDTAPYADLMAALCSSLAPSMLALAKSSQPRAPRRGKGASSQPDGAEAPASGEPGGSGQAAPEPVSADPGATGAHG